MMTYFAPPNWPVLRTMVQDCHGKLSLEWFKRGFIDEDSGRLAAPREATQTALKYLIARQEFGRTVVRSIEDLMLFSSRASRD